MNTQQRRNVLLLVSAITLWGTEYVGPHAPLRGAEEHHWRVYAGADDVTVAVDPPQANTPIQLARRGDWAELVVPAGTNLLFSGDGPFMPVQYVTSYFEAGVEIGAPAMVQMVPTAQFLSRYVSPACSSSASWPFGRASSSPALARTDEGRAMTVFGSGALPRWRFFGRSHRPETIEKPPRCRQVPEN
jgi:hypothetical protein